MAASLSSPSWYNSADGVKNPGEAVIGCNAAEEIIQMSRRGTERETLCQTCVKSTKNPLLLPQQSISNLGGTEQINCD